MARVRLVDSFSVGVARIARATDPARDIITAGMSVGTVRIARSSDVSRGLLSGISVGKAAPEDMKDFTVVRAFEF